MAERGAQISFTARIMARLLSLTLHAWGSVYKIELNESPRVCCF